MIHTFLTLFSRSYDNKSSDGKKNGNNKSIGESTQSVYFSAVHDESVADKHVGRSTLETNNIGHMSPEGIHNQTNEHAARAALVAKRTAETERLIQRSRAFDNKPSKYKITTMASSSRSLEDQTQKINQLSAEGRPILEKKRYETIADMRVNVTTVSLPEKKETQSQSIFNLRRYFTTAVNKKEDVAQANPKKNLGNMSNSTRLTNDKGYLLKSNLECNTSESDIGIDSKMRRVSIYNTALRTIGGNKFALLDARNITHGVVDERIIKLLKFVNRQIGDLEGDKLLGLRDTLTGVLDIESKESNEFFLGVSDYSAKLAYYKTISGSSFISVKEFKNIVQNMYVIKDSLLNKLMPFYKSIQSILSEVAIFNERVTFKSTNELEANTTKLKSVLAFAVVSLVDYLHAYVTAQVDGHNPKTSKSKVKNHILELIALVDRLGKVASIRCMDQLAIMINRCQDNLIKYDSLIITIENFQISLKEELKRKNIKRNIS